MGDAPNLNQIEGCCLCGAITVRGTMARPMVRACHCDMCRKHTSSMFMSIGLDTDSIEVAGDVQTYASSDWAERGFCGSCGSTIFYRTLHDGARNLSAGLFDNAGGAPLELEYFADRCPQGYHLAGDHRKMTTQETIALFAPSEGETR
ncbi:Glutathione-dependent formaldehyde-activating enzyme-like protein [Sulfitobacter noctilucae]|uniref:GFA family protein n=1 Tax=Sulfitobacter noctilucae TaxID=1342302 RepID=UPI0005613BF5|nr:GFA family protein [Sulfitobacter noctilucae]KIN65632.1 Glutathione-dependent formaldehyde-activating enzyme-like protein [Sulfitobacter noctilucae]